MKVCIAEKPGVARDIASVIGATKRKDGYFEGNGYAVTWTYGHLCSLKEPADYDARWKYWNMGTLPMIPERFGIKALDNEGAVRQLEVIRKLFAQAEEIINCGDAGQEGELIQRWVMQYSKAGKPVKRLWISSLTEEAIKDGFDNLRDGKDFDNLYAAGCARAIGDWLLGINATRLYTIKYGNGKSVLSVGRVQTPTLALVVKRQQEIDNFVPVPYWELKTIYRDVEFSLKQGRFDKKEDAEALLEEIKDIPFTIASVKKSDGKEIPPGLKLMILPAAAALEEPDAERLLDFVLNGGTLFCEGGCGHYNGTGAYLEPERRFIAEATGVTEHPERIRYANKRVKYGFGRETFFLNAGEFLTPYLPVKKFTETVAPLNSGLDLISQVKYGRGRIILCAPYFSALYQEKRNAELENFVQHLCFSVGVKPPVRILKTPGNAVPFLRLLKDGGHRMLFVFLPSMTSRCELEFPSGFWEKRTLTDLYGGGRLRVTQSGGAQRVKLKPPHKKIIVLYE